MAAPDPGDQFEDEFVGHGDTPGLEPAPALNGADDGAALLAMEEQDKLDLITWDFSEFFLPLLDEYVRTDLVNIDQCIQVLRKYISDGYLFPGDETLPENHKNFVLNEALPAVTNICLRKFSFNHLQVPGLIENIQRFLCDVIDLMLLYLPLNRPKQIDTLTLVMDQAKSLYRIYSGTVVQWVKANCQTACSWGDPTKSLAYWGDSSLMHVAHNINYFGDKGGFDVIRQQLAGAPMPMDALVSILKLFVKLRPMMGPRLLELRLQLPDLVFNNQLLDLGTDDLRRVEKSHIALIDTNMRQILRETAEQTHHVAVGGAKINNEECDQFCRDFALKCLRSQIQDKKYNGLTYIEESITRVTAERKHILKHPVSPLQVPGIITKTRSLLDWIINNQIVEIVFHRDNMRRELIICSKKIIKFLQQENALNSKHVAIILDGIQEYHHERNADIREALYDTLIDSADKITKVVIARQIWETLRRLDRKEYCSRTVKLLKSLVMGSRDEAFQQELITTLFELVQDDSRSSRETMDEALIILPPLAKNYQFDLIPECQAQLAESQRRGGGVQILQILISTLKETSDETSRVALSDRLLEEGLWDLILTDLSFYKRRATAAARGDKNVDATILWGRLTHQEQIEQRLTLISEFLDVSDKVLEAVVFKDLWKRIVGQHTITEHERGFGIEWIWQMACHDDELIEFLFTNVFLKNFEQLVQSETGVRIFVRSFFCVNSDLKNLRLIDVADNTKVGINANFEALRYPYVGIRQLLDLTLSVKDEGLFGQLKDLSLNLFLNVDTQVAVTPVDSFRVALAEFVARKINQPDIPALLINRLLRIIKDALVLTKPPPVAEAEPADAVQTEEVDPAELAKPNPPMPATEDQRNKVAMFIEMIGPRFPENYRYVMATMILKDCNWDPGRACEEYMFAAESVVDAKITSRHNEAKAYKMVTEDASPGEEANGSSANTNGLPVADALSDVEGIYDTFFTLFTVTGVETQLAWEVLKLLRPNVKLTDALTKLDTAGHDSVNWATLIGNQPSYQLLYSLELVRQFIPSEADGERERDSKTAWCKAFLHSGGFRHLFNLLRQIALQPRSEDESITRTCLGHLLKILFYFMKTSLAEPGSKAALALTSHDGVDELRFSTSSTAVLTQEAPFDEFPDILWALIYDRANEELPTAQTVLVEEQGDTQSSGNVVTYAMFLLVGAILSRPQLLHRLFATENFNIKVVEVLCSPSIAVRQRMMQQLQRLCSLYEDSSPRDYLVTTLSASINMLDDRGFSGRSQHLFELLSSLLSTEGAASGDLNIDSLCDLICARQATEVSSFGEQDQSLAGLMSLAASLVQESPEIRSRVGERMVPELLHNCLFTDSAASKCIAGPTRNAAFLLLNALCNNCFENFAPVAQFFAKHQLAQEPVTSWRNPERNEKRSPFVGVRNLGATCYMNASLQQMYMMPAVRQAVLSAKAGKCDADDITWQTQRLFGMLSEGDAQYADTEDFTNAFKDVGGGPINVRRQEDASEFISRFQEVMENQLKGQPQEKVFTNMFGVEQMQEIECVNGHVKQRGLDVEPSLMVEFRGTLSECLSTTFPVGGDPISDYVCDDCEGKVDILKRQMIHRTQDYLMVVLNRFRYDYGAAGSSRVKLTEEFKIPHQINLQEFTAAGAGSRRLGKVLELDLNWQYNLNGIVVHSGRTMDSGHYYSIIRDGDQWYKFDDREVSAFDQSWLFETHPKFIGESYILFFQREGVKHALGGDVRIPSDIKLEVEKVNREVLSRRRFFEPEYFSFMFELFMSCPKIPRESSLRLDTVKLGTLFTFETLARAPTDGKADVFQRWVDKLVPMYEMIPEAAAWFLVEILGQRKRWLRHFLLDCEEQWLRAGFASVLLAAMGALVHLEEFPESPDSYSKKQLGLVGRTGEQLFLMLESSRPNWRKIEEYMRVLLEYCKQSDAQRRHLLVCSLPSYSGHSLRIIAYLLDWYSGSKSSLCSWEQKRNRLVMKDSRGFVDLSVFLELVALLVRSSCYSVESADDQIVSGEALPGQDGRLVPLDAHSKRFLFDKTLVMNLIKSQVNIGAVYQMFRHWATSRVTGSLELTLEIANCVLGLIESHASEDTYAHAMQAALFCLARIDDDLKCKRVQIMLDMFPAHGRTSVLATLRTQHYHYHVKAKLVGALAVLCEAAEEDSVVYSFLATNTGGWTWVTGFLRQESQHGVHAQACLDLYERFHAISVGEGAPQGPAYSPAEAPDSSSSGADVVTAASATMAGADQYDPMEMEQFDDDDDEVYGGVYAGYDSDDDFGQRSAFSRHH